MFDTTCTGASTHSDHLAANCAVEYINPSSQSFFGPPLPVLTHTTSLGCTVGAGSTPALPPKANYAVNSQYADSSCSGKVLGKELVMEGVCIADYDPTSGAQLSQMVRLTRYHQYITQSTSSYRCLYFSR